jgi:hypothetical protein
MTLITPPNLAQPKIFHPAVAVHIRIMPSLDYGLLPYDTPGWTIRLRYLFIRGGFDGLLPGYDLLVGGETDEKAALRFWRGSLFTIVNIIYNLCGFDHIEGMRLLEIPFALQYFGGGRPGL